MATLTTRTLATGASLNDLIHIVITGDTSQSPSGSSYKSTLSQLQPLFLFTGGSGNCITNLYVDNIRACTNEITIFNRVQSVGSDAQNTLSFAWGLTNVASANYSFAFGTGTTASGVVSHAEGIDTLAIGNYSHAEGNVTRAGGEAAHSEGFSTNASGNYSHAEGSGSAAFGVFSHAQNKSTMSRGTSSHAGGNQSITDGPNSFAHGFIDYAGGESTVVIGGQYNSVLSGSTQNSGIFGGESNTISGATSPSDPTQNSVIIGGSGNTITYQNSSIIASENSKLTADHSVILGGYNMTGTTAETVFVPNFVLYSTYRYTPSGTTDLPGKPVGTVTWDDNYFYYKGTTGWRRISGATW